MSANITYSDSKPQKQAGEFELAAGTLHILAATELTDAEGEALLEEIKDDLEAGLAAIAERLHEKLHQPIRFAVET